MSWLKHKQLLACTTRRPPALMLTADLKTSVSICCASRKMRLPSSAKRKRKRRDLDSLDFAKKMLVQFLDFAESHFDNMQFRDMGQRLYLVNQRTREYEKMLVAKWFKILRRMVGMTVPTEEEIRRRTSNFVAITSSCTTSSSQTVPNGFREDSAIQDQFLKSVATFLREFDQRW